MDTASKLQWIDDQTSINWNELSELYRVAPLGNKPPEALKTVFTNSMFKYFLFDQDKIIGAGRLLADGIDCAYLCDIVIHPDYQGSGIGKQLVEKLLEQAKGHKKIILYANPGKEGFYQSLGFLKMNTAMAIFKDKEHALQSGVVSLNDNNH